MDTHLQETLKLLAHPNWRGTSSSQLVYFLPNAADIIEDYFGYPDYLRDAIWPPKQPPQDEEHIFYMLELGKGIEEESNRRRALKCEGAAHTNQDIIAAIKDSIAIEDVLAWYTDVFLHRKNWTYRCTLHGQDQHPSGAIYPKERRAWCFTCNRGGDVFDIVQLFERVELPAAIKKLAQHVGLDVKSHRKRMGIEIE